MTSQDPIFLAPVDRFTASPPFTREFSWQGTQWEGFFLSTAKGLRGYLNLCRHQGVPLDFGDGDFLDEECGLLRCKNHGALYRQEDGLCVEGPCQGKQLYALPLKTEGDLVYLDVTALDLPHDLFPSKRWK